MNLSLGVPRHPGSTLKLVCLAAWSLLALSASAVAAPQPGELLEIKVDTPNGAAVVRFRFCPPGELLRGKPTGAALPTGTSLKDRMKRRALLAEMKGSYIAESEISWQQFERILGQAASNQVLGRMLAGESEGRGSQFPIRGVTVIEAAAFCEALGKFDAAGKANRPGLEDRKFRLPTHDEWQYACRAIDDPELTQQSPYFSGWPALKDVPKAVVSDCNDVWTKTLNRQAAFTGSQEEVIEVIQAHKTPRRGAEILSAFLGLALGTQRSYSTIATGPQPVGTGKANGWKLFNMHDNVFEWTIAVSDPDRLSALWDLLASGNAAELTNDDAKILFLAGGGYNDSIGDKPENWVKFSIWGGQPMEGEVASAYTFSEAKTQDVETSPGFRVLLQRVLAQDWLLAIRNSSVLDQKLTLPEIKQRLAEDRATVAELSTGEVLTKAEARIKYYEALAAYRHDAKAETNQLLADVSGLLDAEDPYFAHVRELVSLDAQ